MAFVITGESLRSAREAAHLTQQQVADRVGVSLRTVGNWERSSDDAVPRKWWSDVRRFLPKADIDVAMKLPPQINMDIDGDDFQSDLRASVRRIFGDGPLNGEQIQNLSDMYDGAAEALDWAELATASGVDPELIRQLTASVVSIVIDSGTYSVFNATKSHDPLQEIIFRASQIAARADANSTRKDSFRSRISFPKPSVSPPGEDDEAGIETEAEVQSAYGESAHRGPRKADEPHAE
ncbi:helix-turn-helix transcriptional regulator [Curtobacterium sp. MCSS17_015]|uniref:helix-turn-helix transcriptional regulator n=1 Tax=Curtobacterium sp. MCSS17_015 TaxID=2175666 RepID=UPI000DA84C55|nr:helix-turn-helix transcriptional regulator [Curtobacterium sp. MCSS17_015]WIB25400.1 helix-turn-helix transcriptional regulator [Curtobacterium sp. MCSS17_015]